MTTRPILIGVIVVCHLTVNPRQVILTSARLLFMADDFKDQNQPYAGMIADLKMRRERLLQEAQKIEAAVAALDALYGGAEYVPATGDQPNAVAGADPTIRVGEFHGLGIPN